MEYRISKFTVGTLRASMAIYLLMAVLLFSQALLGALLLAGVPLNDAFPGSLLWNRAHYSAILLAIELLLFLYAVYGVIDVQCVICRLRTVVLRIDGVRIEGFSLPRPHTWKRGKPFSVSAADVLSVGVLEVKLHGRSAANSLLINTASESYVLPALDDIARARKQLELARERAQQPPAAQA